MKRSLYTIALLLFALATRSQITSPVIRANFGVDADLRANYYNGALQPGNDDWYNLPGTAGTGAFVIDTTGAAAILARYSVDMAFRRSTFARSMRYLPYTVVNNRVLLDAILVRDFHGDDSTVFASGSNKNGDNPADWSTPVSQGIPDKNDILDMLVHARRAGPNGSDSLWLFGGMSLDNTTGNRYFDFEMYQTDLYYNRDALTFGGQGPDEGHTSWEFDAAGNVTKAGDIIFSAEYQSSSLSNIEARIWVPRAVRNSLVPSSFNWGLAFDGSSASSTYGYAAIQPKGAGAYYTGLQCGNNTWGGPFGVILQNDVFTTDYDARQYVEFSVNLTKLGLDPLTRLGGDPCGLPFRRVIVKTRASASFTAELKDFVAPFAFVDVPAAELATTTPLICNEGSVSQIYISNPLPTSTYQWSTVDGNIISPTTGTSIFVDTPGSYIVTQFLMAGCGAYKSDTIQIGTFPICDVLSTGIVDLAGHLTGNLVHLSWKANNNQFASAFEIQRSIDGMHFSTVGVVSANPAGVTGNYTYTDPVVGLQSNNLYYRIRAISVDQSKKLSNTIRMTVSAMKNAVVIYPNPVQNLLQIQLSAKSDSRVKIELFDASGKRIASPEINVQQGQNVVTLNHLADQPIGVYIAVISLNGKKFREKILVTR